MLIFLIEECIESNWSPSDFNWVNISSNLGFSLNLILLIKALLNLEITHKFVLGCLERVKGRYKKSLKLIRKHLSNNFEEFLYFECIDGFKKIFYNSILGIDSVKKSKIFSQKDSTG